MTPGAASIELHSNPWYPEADEVQSFLPLFNRALIFETNEYSWHGFKRIVLPEDRKHLSRKSFSIYLYTKDRPAEDVVAPHTTFYVPPPLPERVAAGVTLSEQRCAADPHRVPEPRRTDTHVPEAARREGAAPARRDPRQAIRPGPRSCTAQRDGHALVARW